MTVSLLPQARRWVAGLAALLLAGCASLGGANGSAPAAAGATAASAPAASFPGVSAPQPPKGAPRAFDDVIRGATQQPGFLPLWKQDDKVWLEIPEHGFSTPFLLSANVSHSVGERGLFGSQMGPSWLVVFRKVGTTQIQLVALNTQYVATTEAMKIALEQGFSHSLLASMTVASALHPERKSVLVDAGFLLSDIPGLSTRVEQVFRIPYGLDRSNSFVEKTRATEELTSLSVRLHFFAPRLPVASATVSPPTVIPDARSFFVGAVYSFTRLPEKPMAPRHADPRLGHFADVVNDISDDLKANPKQHFINRWRLEKRDPDAALSEPKQPIVYWLDRNIPRPYRKAVEEGVLMWNQAFERIGFKNAIQVRQQPDDADWDNMDARHASIRWYVGADAGTAVGPHHSDPRTGEIIDADIAMSDVFGRSSRRFIVENVGFAPRPQLQDWVQSHGADGVCHYAFEAAAEMSFALDLLETRGDIAPDSLEAEAFVQAVIKDTIAHEVGHTLGLKHNFKASTVFTPAQLRDPAFTARHGTSGSVMDYNAFNLPTQGEVPTKVVNTTLGPYDYWAIEYAYSSFAPAEEPRELARIAARSTEPWLAYADDVDAGGYGSEGIDPLVNRFDLGSDPLSYWHRRLQLSRELWARIQSRQLQPHDDPTRQRRLLLSGFRQLSGAAELAGKYVGGVYTLRDVPGGRAAYTPVEPDRQRAALRFLSTGLFQVESFRFKPEFLRSLSPDYNEWDRGGGPVSVPAEVLKLQVVALDRLMSTGTALRLLDLPLYVPEAQAKNIITLGEVHGTLQNAIWQELAQGGEINLLRRNLQREHLRRLQLLLLKGAPALLPDALSVARLQATRLQQALQRANSRPGLSMQTRAHLQDSLASLTQALQASMQRTP